METCFFIGHRDTSDTIFPLLLQTILHHITHYDVTTFTVGNYGSFDRMAARAVAEAKRLYPNIRLSLLLPYHPAERPVKLPNGFDTTFYPPGMEAVPRKFAIVCANQYMVDHSDYLIACVCHPASNARQLLEYAGRRKIFVTNIAANE